MQSHRRSPIRVLHAKSSPELLLTFAEKQHDAGPHRAPSLSSGHPGSTPGSSPPQGRSPKSVTGDRWPGHSPALMSAPRAHRQPRRGGPRPGRRDAPLQGGGRPGERGCGDAGARGAAGGQRRDSEARAQGKKVLQPGSERRRVPPTAGSRPPAAPRGLLGNVVPEHSSPQQLGRAGGREGRKEGGAGPPLQGFGVGSAQLPRLCGTSLFLPASWWPRPHPGETLTKLLGQATESCLPGSLYLLPAPRFLSSFLRSFVPSWAYSAHSKSLGLAGVEWAEQAHRASCWNAAPKGSRSTGTPQVE